MAVPRPRRPFGRRCPPAGAPTKNGGPIVRELPQALGAGATSGAKGIAIGMGVCDKERCNLLPFVTSAFRQNF